MAVKVEFQAVDRGLLRTLQRMYRQSREITSNYRQQESAADRLSKTTREGYDDATRLAIRYLRYLKDLHAQRKRQLITEEEFIRKQRVLRSEYTKIRTEQMRTRRAGPVAGPAAPAPAGGRAGGRVGAAVGVLSMVVQKLTQVIEGPLNEILRVRRENVDFLRETQQQAAALTPGGRVAFQDMLAMNVKNAQEVAVALEKTGQLADAAIYREVAVRGRLDAARAATAVGAIQRAGGQAAGTDTEILAMSRYAAGGVASTQQDLLDAYAKASPAFAKIGWSGQQVFALMQAHGPEVTVELAQRLASGVYARVQGTPRSRRIGMGGLPQLTEELQGLTANQMRLQFGEQGEEIATAIRTGVDPDAFAREARQAQMRDLRDPLAMRLQARASVEGAANIEALRAAREQEPLISAEEQVRRSEIGSALLNLFDTVAGPFDELARVGAGWVTALGSNQTALETQGGALVEALNNNTAAIQTTGPPEPDNTREQ